MIIMAPAAALIHNPLQRYAVNFVEQAGRLSWKSEDKITEQSSEPFVRMLIRAGHESVLEHVGASVLFLVDRGVSHELVRHRLASFPQESTRYCNYNKTGEVTFIRPPFWSEDNILYKDWLLAMEHAESVYLRMIRAGAKPQEARSVLPNSLKTELMLTANLREWRHIFRLRCAKAAHPQMREVMIPLLAQFREAFHPVFFEDITDIAPIPTVPVQIQYFAKKTVDTDSSV
jgi:thymidylate synthase (FAD)